MKKDDLSKEQSSPSEHDFSDLDFDIDEYLENLKQKYQVDPSHEIPADTTEDKNKENLPLVTEDEKQIEEDDPLSKDEEELNKEEEAKEEYLAEELALTRMERNQNSKDEKPNEPNKKTIARKIANILGCLILIIALGFTAYGGYLFYRAHHLLDNTIVERKNSESKTQKITMTKKPISVLIMGLDNNKERKLESTRTDSLILCTFNPKNGKVSMVSIPRDTYVTMYNKEEGYNTTGKINSAYSIDGVDSTIDAVKNLLNVPIDYYIQVDFAALQDIVDDFGGIKVDVPFTLTEQDANGKKRIHLTKGKNQTLNGEQALAFARTRHIDNDIERGVRQQQVIEAIVDKALSTKSMTKYGKVLDSLTGNIQTDMPESVMLGLAKSSLEHKVKIQHYQFKWASFNYNGESYVALNQESLDFISHRLRVALGLDEKDERDDENYQEPETTTLDPNTYPSYGVVWDN